MADTLDPREIVTVRELLLSQMFEMGALLDLLERKGILTKQEFLDEVKALQQKTAKGSPMVSAGELSSERDDAIVTHFLDVFNHLGLTSAQAREILNRLDVLVELGERVAKANANTTTH